MPKIYIGEAARHQAKLERDELRRNRVFSDALCRTKVSDEALAKSIGCNRTTISSYRCHPESIKDAKFNLVRRLVRKTMSAEQALQFMGY